MGMTVSSSSDEDEVVSAINTTPLVDVMLVLLIIFLITVPVVTQSITLDLPKEKNQVTQTKPENVNLAVTAKGDVYWNTQKISDNKTLVEKLKVIAVLTPQPEVHIRGDQNADYQYVGKVVLACQRAGIVKVGFISEPPSGGVAR